MLTYVVIHSALAPWRLPRRESGSSVKENRKGLRRLRLGVSGPSRSIPQIFCKIFRCINISRRFLSSRVATGKGVFIQIEEAFHNLS